ncbi:LuxR C-terminal-related transcriptional regulator [Isoptericola halotolerans]|uniref:LuxR C-terminal-related transcriptional regulator n=1 Tax=Isoptericola halotolerans TaxID=300560 RepID=UPI003890D073
MLEESGRPVTARPDLGVALLTGKLQVPTTRRGTVSRRPLIDRARASGARVVGVTAPPGYGKSTMLAEWADLEDREVVWATVDRLDDDPASLLSLLALACAPVSPEVAEVVSDMRGTGLTVLGRSAPLLAAALVRTAAPFVLFVDDLHEAGSPGCQDALEIVLGHVPAGSQVVISSRHDQPHLARRRVEGTVMDIGPDDLTIDVTGARALFASAEVDVDDSTLATVVERCEGWPTGLLLCALLVRDGGAASSLSGDDRFVADYLYRECLARLPVRTQHFLRSTAVLDHLSAGLCDAVLGSSGSATILRGLDTSNLFLIPLDHRRRRFRYHTLFREFLLDELARVEPDAVTALHRRAAAWYEANDLGPRAVEHLLAAGDRERCCLLMADLALPLYQSGQVAVIARWLAAVGDAAIQACPPLAVIAAWKAILLGETTDAERWAAALEQVDTDSLPDDDRVALESARRQIRAAMCLDDVELGLAHTRFAVEHEPAWSPWRDQALHLHGSMLLLTGDADGARDAFTEASACATQAGNPDSVLLSEAELAILAVEDGRWTTAAQHARAAVDVIDTHHMEGYSTTTLALAARARVALHTGDVVAAERLLARGMRARVQCTHVLPFLAVKVRLQLGYAFMTLGDRVTALHLAHEAASLLRRRPHLGLLADETATLLERLEHVAASPGAPPLTPAELRLLPYLQTHLTMAEIGDRLFVSRNTVSTQVGSIYRKLGATTRGEAVGLAVDLGLLGA